MKKSEIEFKQIDWFDDRFYRVRYVNDAKIEVEDYIPSVTTKLGALSKPSLYRWYGDLGTREAQLRRDEQADRGSRIHWAWQAFCTGGVIIYDPIKTPLYTDDEIKELKERHNNNYFIIRTQDEMWQCMKLQEFHKRINPEMIASELIVCDIQNRDAGTLDNQWLIKEGEYEVNGSKPLCLKEGLYILDVKTGNSISKDYRMQIAAYAKCLESMEAEKRVQGALIVWTSSKNKKGIEGLGVVHLNRDEIEEEYSDYRDIAKVWERNFGNAKPTIRQIPGFITLGG